MVARNTTQHRISPQAQEQDTSNTHLASFDASSVITFYLNKIFTETVSVNHSTMRSTFKYKN